MNIKTNKNLMESENNQIPVPSEIKIGNEPEIKNQQTFETVLNVKSKQFLFDNGGLMAKIPIDTGNKFGLKWHKDNTTNFDEFIKSIENFLLSCDIKMTDLDKKRLETEYFKN